MRKLLVLFYVFVILVIFNTVLVSSANYNASNKEVFDLYITGKQESIGIGAEPVTLSPPRILNGFHGRFGRYGKNHPVLGVYFFLGYEQIFHSDDFRPSSGGWSLSFDFPPLLFDKANILVTNPGACGGRCGWWGDGNVVYRHLLNRTSHFVNLSKTFSLYSLEKYGGLLGEEWTVYSSNPKVIVWVGEGEDEEGASAPTEKKITTDDKAVEIFACLDYDLNKVCDIKQAENCVESQGDWLGGKCCGFNEAGIDGYSECNGFIDTVQINNGADTVVLKAVCGKDNDGNNRWASLSSKGEIFHFNCPDKYKGQFFSSVDKFLTCKNSVFTNAFDNQPLSVKDRFVLDGHEYRCVGNDIFECGGKSPFAGLGKKTGFSFSGIGGANLDFESANQFVAVNPQALKAEVSLAPATRTALSQKAISLETVVPSGSLNDFLYKYDDAIPYTKGSSWTFSVFIRGNKGDKVGLVINRTGRTSSSSGDGSSVEFTIPAEKDLQWHQITHTHIFDQASENPAYVGIYLLPKPSTYVIAVDDANLNPGQASVSKNVEYCTSLKNFSNNLDFIDQDSCEQAKRLDGSVAGFKWTGSKCCSETDDPAENYNDKFDFNSFIVSSSNPQSGLSSVSGRVVAEGTPISDLTLTTEGAHVVSPSCPAGYDSKGNFADCGGGSCQGNQLLCAKKEVSQNPVIDAYFTPEGVHVVGGHTCLPGYDSAGGLADCGGGNCFGNQLLCVKKGSSQEKLWDVSLTVNDVHIEGGQPCSSSFVSNSSLADCGGGRCFGNQRLCLLKTPPATPTSSTPTLSSAPSAFVKESGKIILANEGDLISLRGPLKLNVVIQAKTAGIRAGEFVEAGCGQVSSEVVEIPFDKTIDFKHPGKGDPVPTGSQCVFRTVYITLAGAKIGGCLDKQFYGHGALAENGKAINYNGNFLGCNLASSDQLASVKDSFTNKNLVANNKVCTSIPSASFDGKTGVCHPFGLWAFSDYPVNDVIKKASWKMAQGQFESGCCPDNTCWDGSTCRKIGDIEAIEDEKKAFFCTVESAKSAYWKSVVFRANYDKSSFGFCTTDARCLIDKNFNDSLEGVPSAFYTGLDPMSKPRCIDNGQYVLDYSCENGNWSSRTKFLALQLLDFAEQKSSDDFSLFCDSKDIALNSMMYVVDSARVFELVSTTCKPFDSVTEFPCVNNFCVLNYANKTAFGTSLNVGIKSDKSILSALNASPTACDNAVNSDVFAECFEKTKQNAKLFYNNKLQSIIYVPSENLGSFSISVLFEKYFLVPFKKIFDYGVKTKPADVRLKDLLSGAGLYNTIFVSKKDSKSLFAFMERQIAGYDYIGVHFTNINIGPDPCITLFKQIDSSIICENQVGNEFFLVHAKPATLIAIWKDLTSKLRPG